MITISFVNVLRLLIIRVPCLPGVNISEAELRSWTTTEFLHSPNLSSGGLDWGKKSQKKKIISGQPALASALPPFFRPSPHEIPKSQKLAISLLPYVEDLESSGGDTRCQCVNLSKKSRALIVSKLRLNFDNLFGSCVDNRRVIPPGGRIRVCTQCWPKPLYYGRYRRRSLNPLG